MGTHNPPWHRHRNTINITQGDTPLLLLGLQLSAFIFLSRIERQIQENGHLAEATVTRHFIHEDGSPWLNYQFSDHNDRIYRHSRELPESVWAELSEGDLLEVKYLPENPDMAALGILGSDAALLRALIIVVLIGIAVTVPAFLMYLTGHDLEYLNGKFIWLSRGELAEDKL